MLLLRQILYLYLSKNINNYEWREYYYVRYINQDGRANSWISSASDIFAEDWEVITE